MLLALRDWVYAIGKTADNDFKELVDKIGNIEKQTGIPNRNPNTAGTVASELVREAKKAIKGN
jgi:hypothetical protein